MRRLVTFVFLLALVATACDSAGGDTTQPPATTTVPAGSSTSTTSGSSDTITPPPESPAPPIAIVRVDDPSFDGGALRAVIEAGPGLVAVGTDEVPEDAAVWVSEDATTWDRIESDSFFGEDDAQGLEGAQGMFDVVDGPAGIVAVGEFEVRSERDIDAGVWISEDGLTWERVEHEALGGTGTQTMYGITTWNGEYVAVGVGPGPVGSGERRPAIWISEDARTWERVDVLALRMDASIDSIVRRGSRLYAVGSSGHVLRPTLWFSEDGRSWDVVHAEGSGDSLVGSIDIGAVDDLSDASFNSIAITPDGFVAAGGTGFPSQAIFWRSDDGLFWDLVGIVSDTERPSDPVYVSSVATTGRGIVAVGTAQLDTTRFPPITFAEVWVSTDDGASWGQVPRTSSSMALDGPWHVGTINDVIAYGDGVLMVGYVPYQNVTLPGPFYHQAVWIGTWG